MSVNFIKSSDHVVNGRLDFGSYQAAQIANGDRCSECETYIVFPKGYPDRCQQCKEAKTGDGELTHSIMIRCPRCRHMIDASDVAEGTDYKLYDGNDDTSVTCYECEHEFQVRTFISYTYVSPAMGETEIA